MASPWDPDFRSRHANNLMSERSTSAPPPKTSFLFGGSDGFGHSKALGGNAGSLEAEKWNAHFDSRKYHESRLDPLIIDSSRSKQDGLENSGLFTNPPPGFSDKLSGRAPFGSSLGEADVFDRNRMIGENLMRSQSAAPSLDGRLSTGLPLGLANSDTPLVSNRGQVDSYLESTMDSSRILQLGQRRPASTGVIGGPVNSSHSILSSLGLRSSPTGSRDAVRPAAKTLMDLIQEDFPPESPIDSAGFRDEICLERPRTTSPLSFQTREYRYEDLDIDRRGGGGAPASFDHLQMDRYDEYKHQVRRGPPPQFVPSVPSTSVYSHTIQPTRPHAQTIHQQSQFEQQQQQQQQHVFGNPTSHIQYVQTHVLPNGQTVYVNAPPLQQQYGGQSPVRYQAPPPPPQQHQIFHQVPAGIGPNGEQYISVVPIQVGAPMPGSGPGGGYAYYQADNEHSTSPTYIASGGHASPSNRGGGNRMEIQRHAPVTGRGGREKGGRGKRGAGNRRGGDQKPPGSSSASPLLETFKAKKNRDWTIADIKGHIVEFSLDQNGSRFIQHRLEIGSSEEKEVTMAEVLPALSRLRNDVFGNYVVQKLLDFGTPKMREGIRDTLYGEMLQLSLQMYGCRVVQKALETLDDGDIPRLFAEFHHNVLSCIHDQNGNHVIQKCIEVMGEKSKKSFEKGDSYQAKYFEKELDFIVDDVLNNVRSLSCHPYGCRVLQRILEHCPEHKKNEALDEIKQYHSDLIEDQYGNYVIQHVLQYGRSSDRDSVLEIVVESGLLMLSRQKFASNVVEKLLKYGNPKQRSGIVREMLKRVDEQTGQAVQDGVQGTSVVLLMVKDAYANYVVQTTLDVVVDVSEKQSLMEELNSHSTELKNYTFAKHIVTKLEMWSSRAKTP